MMLKRRPGLVVRVIGALGLLGCGVESGDSDDAGAAGMGGDGGSGGGQWCADDTAEPNQDRATAASVSFAFRGSISSADDVDVFHFSASRSDATARLIAASALVSEGQTLELEIEAWCEPTQTDADIECRQGTTAEGAEGIVCTAETEGTHGVSAEVTADCDAVGAFITVRPTASVSACAGYTVTGTSYDVAAR